MNLSNGNIASLILLATAIPAAAVAIAASTPIYLRWLERYPLLGGILGLILAVIYGWVGRDLGLDHLFWHDEAWVQVAAGVSLAILALILILMGYLLEADPAAVAGRCRRALAMPWTLAAAARGRPRPPVAAPGTDAGRMRLAVEVMGLPLLVLVWLPFLVARLTARPGRSPEDVGPGWWLPAGTTAGLLAADLLLRLPSARRWHARRRDAWVTVLIPSAAMYLAPALAPSLGGRAEGWITAAMVICLLGAIAALLVFATYGRFLLRTLLGVAVVAVMAATNSDPYKLSYPGLEAYSRHNRVALRSETSPLRIASPADRITRDGIAGFNGILNTRTGEISDYDGVLGQMDEAIRHDPRYTPAYYFRGVIHKRRGDLKNYHSDDRQASVRPYELALSDYSRAIELGDGTAEVRFQRGLTGERLRDFTRSKVSLESIVADYRDAAARDPGSARIRAHLARMLEISGARAEADSLYRETARLMIDLHAAGIVKPPPELPGESPALPDRGAFDRPSDPPAPDSPGEPLDTYPEAAGYASYRQALRLARRGRLDEAEREYVEALRTPAGDGPYRDGRLPLDQYTWHRSARTERHTGLLEDRGVLNRWRLARHATRGDGRADRLPRLAVVSVSGGGIVAAAWAARCLTEIEREYAGFPHDVRIVTGASGGMVGAGLYVASLPRPGSAGAEDPGLRQGRIDRIRAAIDKDSLTPVVRRMGLSDIPLTFWPAARTSDRGRALELAWMENTGPVPGIGGSPAVDRDPAGRGGPGPLGVTFRELRRGELEGWRPSLVVSPLLVENGAQMVISNLDLEHVGGINLHFFSIFTEAYGRFPLSTALRMNAAFPLVTPAVSLPTEPPVRIADAGYVDNYGVRLAAEWLRQNAQWLSRHTSGVALVQVRAYPLGIPGYAAEGARLGRPRPAGTAAGTSGFSIARGLQGLTSPIEGYTTARKMGMVSMNDTLVKAVRGEFEREVKSARQELGGEGDDGSNFLQSFVFENSEDVPLGWSLTRPDSLRLDRSLKAVEPEVRLLVDYLRDGKLPRRD